MITLRELEAWEEQAKILVAELMAEVMEAMAGDRKQPPVMEPLDGNL